MSFNDPIIAEILSKKKVTAPSGREFSTDVGISMREAGYIHDIVQGDESVRQTLEVGCALGISSVAIARALKSKGGAKHTIVDPRQTEGWESLGIDHMKQTGFEAFELIEDGSQFALPALAKANPGSYDFVFIDGWHTFDHTLMDMFYANLLLRVGGYLTVDDASWRPVAKAISYWKRYPNYRMHSVCQRGGGNSVVQRLAAPAVRAASPLLPSPIADWGRRTAMGSMVTFVKTAEDQRSWDWYPSAPW